MRIHRTLTLVVSLGLLSACAASPPVRYYALDAAVTHDQVQSKYGAPAATRIVGVGPLSFPDYLKRPQIVTRTSASELTVADFDRWAEPLDAAFQRTLAANVDALLPNALVIEYPFGGGRIKPDFRVIAQIARFDVGADRVAVLDVSWGITKHDGERVSAPRRSRYQADAGGSDYNSMVGALKQVLEAFSRDLAGVLQDPA